MTPEEQSIGSTSKPGLRGRSRGRRTFRPQRRPRPPSAPLQPSTETAADSPPEHGTSTEVQAELPTAEIAESGEPMSASVADEAGEREFSQEHAEMATEAEREHEESRRESRHDVGGSRRVPATSAIQQAIEQIQKINKDLEWVLLEMEKALETLEEAEVQKYADEREIEALKNALRQFHRTRESVQRSSQAQRPDPRSRQARDPRGHRDERGRRFDGRRQRHEGRPSHNAEARRDEPRAGAEPGREEEHSAPAPEPPRREEHGGGEPPDTPEIPV